jgi:isoleucyl-tRNA synthetase
MSAEELSEIELNNTITLGDYYGVDLTDIEILTEDMPGYLTASEGSLTIALDNQLTPALISEGKAREFVNRIQNLRKDSGFDVVDKIHIEVLNAEEEWSKSLTEYKLYISQEVQALSLEFKNQSAELFTSIEIDESTLEVRVWVV